MSNEHVAEPFRSILNGIVQKKHLQGQQVRPRPATNRDRFDALSEVHAELEAAGVSIDIGQLDWAVREVEQRLYEKSLDRQYDHERSRPLYIPAGEEAARVTFKGDVERGK